MHQWASCWPRNLTTSFSSTKQVYRLRQVLEVVTRPCDSVASTTNICVISPKKKKNAKKKGGVSVWWKEGKTAAIVEGDPNGVGQTLPPARSPPLFYFIFFLFDFEQLTLTPSSSPSNFTATWHPCVLSSCGFDGFASPSSAVSIIKVFFFGGKL